MKKEDKEFFSKALLCQMTLYNNNMPFLDCELTEGVIKLLTEQCGYIYQYDDLEKIAPGLSSGVKEDILEIARDIFKLWLKLEWELYILFVHICADTLMLDGMLERYIRCNIFIFSAHIQHEIFCIGNHEELVGFGEKSIRWYFIFEVSFVTIDENCFIF